MKEIKEILRFALCTQPVPKALSVISVRSALPLATGGTQEFLCEKIFLLFPLFLRDLKICVICVICVPLPPATLLRKPCLFTPLPMPPNLIKDRTLSM